MKKALLLLLLTIPAFAALAQQTPPAPKKDPDADLVIDAPAITSGSPNYQKTQRTFIKDPEFPGGVEKFADYLKTNLKYPDQARKNRVQGKVFLTFVVEADGSVSDVKVIRGIGNGCDEEAVRLLKASPKWKPGMQNGVPAKANLMLPIAFQL